MEEHERNFPQFKENGQSPTFYSHSLLICLYLQSLFFQVQNSYVKGFFPTIYVFIFIEKTTKLFVKCTIKSFSSKKK